MDTLTHGVIGALAAKSVKAPRSLVNVTALAAVIPDLDYVLFWLNPYLFITDWHRGPSHSLLMLPLWAGVIAAIYRRFSHDRSITLVRVYLFCCLGLLSHIIFDLVTLYGVQLFAPLSDYRFQLSIAFDFDPWIGSIAIVGLIFARIKRCFALLGLLAIAAYLLLLSVNRLTALEIIADHLNKMAVQAQSIHALPRPIQPFHWKLIIVRQNKYEIASLSLSEKLDGFVSSVFSGGREKMVSGGSRRSGAVALRHVVFGSMVYRARNRLQWRTVAKFSADPKTQDLVREAWNLGSFTSFRKFALLPLLYRVDRDHDVECVWFTDLRYVFSWMPPPFRYGSCRDTVFQTWSLYRLKRQSDNDRQVLSDR